MIYAGLMVMGVNLMLAIGADDPDFTAFKVGLSVLLPGAVGLFLMLRLWVRWTKEESALPAHSLFVKVYSGINVLWPGVVAMVMASILCFVALHER